MHLGAHVVEGSMHLKNQLLLVLVKVLLKHTAMYHGDGLVDADFFDPHCHLADDSCLVEDVQTAAYPVAFCDAE